MPNLRKPADALSLADEVADCLESLCKSVERWHAQSTMAGQLTSLYLIAQGSRGALTRYRAAARGAGIPADIRDDLRFVLSCFLDPDHINADRSRDQDVESARRVRSWLEKGERQR
jgi:hypothetical protein